ncbi:MAG: hypothetical protein AB8F26_07985 [Phycisphaerales bacterium]
MAIDAALMHRLVWPFALCSLMMATASTNGFVDVIDRFESAGDWSLILADGVKGEIVDEEGALRLDYDFTSSAGYCVVRRDVEISIDPNYRFGFRWKGSGPPNTLEFKLIDSTGENVWWSVRRDVEFPQEWTPASVRRRHVSFAWGPSGGDPLTQVRSIEFAVTASQGGKGSLWLDDLVYERLSTIEPEPVEPNVTSGGASLGRIGKDGLISWAGTEGESLLFTFDQVVEFSAIELEWQAGQAPAKYRIESMVNDQSTIANGEVVASDAGRDLLFTPEAEAKSVRLTIERGSGILNAVRFLPVEELTTANSYFGRLASESPRGTFPSYYTELSAWTVVGLPGHDYEALMSDTGAIEPVKGGYSLEPFIIRNGQVMTWADADIEQSLEKSSLPIPSVHWSLDGIALDVTAVVTDRLGDECVLARYCVSNESEVSQSSQLVLAARPFQVLPAAQFLNIVGGAVDAESVEVNPNAVIVEDRLFATPSVNADGVFAWHAPSGQLSSHLSDLASWSEETKVSVGSFPSGMLRFDIELQPGESREIHVVLPMTEVPSERLVHEEIDFDAAMGKEQSRWKELLGRTELTLPDSFQYLNHAIRANLAYILINADGPRIQPGSRTYERSWIRDGAMTSAALLALGHEKEARAFIDWYAPFQYENGKIPCVVDARGPDPVDENDAPGEFIFAIRNVAESNGEFDEEFALSMYPRVQSTVGYIEYMRNKRLTDTYTMSDDPILRACSGLMPESISHEGYSEKPMHSHWDNFWVYRGLEDAAVIAKRLGEEEDHVRFQVLSEDFGRSIRASIQQTALIHDIDYVPGCVELGDFDPTSTSIAFYPTGARDVIDDVLLEATFERAWQSTQDRILGAPWDGMTPYEVRTVGTLVRLGWIDRAHRYLDWLFELQDPSDWMQWGEIAYRERSESRFVGDMPHTWVGSGAVLSILSLFAYEDSGVIELAPGVRSEWFESGEIGLTGLRTSHGTLTYLAKREHGRLVLDIEPGCYPPSGYRINARLLGRESGVLSEGDEVAVMADGVQYIIDKEGSAQVPGDVVRIVIGRQSDEGGD